MQSWLQKMLFDWVFVLLYRMLQGLLNLVAFIESFFDVFAGTAKIFYKGDADFLLNVFFGHDAVTNAFWAMALIAVVMAFAFCIVQVARKVADVTGSVRQSVGQIMSNFFRCLLIVILINAATVAAVNITNVLLDRINYALENAPVLNQSEKDKTFTDQEYATMTKILATVANYSANPSATSRYNINSCFNAIRPDLLSLHVNGFFNYDYPMDENGHYSWQGAIALLAASADLTQDLNLDTYYEDVATAFNAVSKEITTYREFAPVKTAHFATTGTLDTDDLIFLIVGMEAAQNAMFDTGDFYDAVRKGYISGEKSYNDMTQVRKDFDIWEMDYLVGYISCITFIIIMAICIFTFIVRIFNILLLYISAPLFVSSMPMDDGHKWNNWIQAFVIQLFSGFGLVVAMRLYLIIIPIVISSDLVFFAGEGIGIAILNHMAQLLMVLGGAWAVLQSGSVITGILAGNPGMAAIQQEGRMGAMVASWAMRAPQAALRGAGSILGGAWKLGKYAAGSGERSRAKADQKAELATRKAHQRQNVADAKYAEADKLKREGGSDRDISRAMSGAYKAQKAADKAITDADKQNLAVGRSRTGLGNDRMLSQHYAGLDHLPESRIPQSHFNELMGLQTPDSDKTQNNNSDAQHKGGVGGGATNGAAGGGNSSGNAANQRTRNLGNSDIKYTAGGSGKPRGSSQAGGSVSGASAGGNANQRARNMGSSGVQYTAGGSGKPRGSSQGGSSGGGASAGGNANQRARNMGSSGVQYTSGGSGKPSGSSQTGGPVGGGSAGGNANQRARNLGGSGVQYTSGGGGQSQESGQNGGSDGDTVPQRTRNLGASGVEYVSAVDSQPQESGQNGGSIGDTVPQRARNLGASGVEYVSAVDSQPQESGQSGGFGGDTVPQRARNLGTSGVEYVSAVDSRPQGTVQSGGSGYSASTTRQTSAPQHSSGGVSGTVGVSTPGGVSGSGGVTSQRARNYTSSGVQYTSNNGVQSQGYTPSGSVQASAPPPPSTPKSNSQSGAGSVSGTVGVSAPGGVSGGGAATQRTRNLGTSGVQYTSGKTVPQKHLPPDDPTTPGEGSVPPRGSRK